MYSVQAKHFKTVRKAHKEQEKKKKSHRPKTQEKWNPDLHWLGYQGKHCKIAHRTPFCPCPHMHVLSSAGNSCCLSLMTHLAHSVLPAQQPLETTPCRAFCPTLPHPGSGSGGRGCNHPLLQDGIQHLVLTLPFRPDWNCLVLHFWPHPLLQRPLNSPFKLGFCAVVFSKLPLIFPHTVCLETMTKGNTKPCLAWVDQRKAAGNACWAEGPSSLPAGRWALAGAVRCLCKTLHSSMNSGYCLGPSSPSSLPVLCYSSHGDTLPLLLRQHSCLWNSCHGLDQGTAFSGN